MPDGKGGWIWQMVIPSLLLLTALGAAVEEVSFRSDAVRTFATVSEWHSEKLGGFRGTAKADIELTGRLLKDRPVRTHLWYRPSPGDRIPVFFGSPTRVDSIWQGFLMPAFLVLVSVGWLVEIWWRRQRIQKSSEPVG